jgi:hypothetical protein
MSDLFIIKALVNFYFTLTLIIITSELPRFIHSDTTDDPLTADLIFFTLLL